MLSRKSNDRWQQLVAKEAREGMLSPEEERELVAYESRHRQSAGPERALWEQFGELGDAPLEGESADRDLIEAALDRLPLDLRLPDEPPMTTQKSAPRFPSRQIAAMLVAGLLGIGGTATGWFLRAHQDSRSEALSATATATATPSTDRGLEAPLPPQPSDAAAEDIVIVEFEEGQMLDSGCSRLAASTEICLEGRAEIASVHPLRVRLDAGRVDVRSSTPITVDSPLGPMVTQAAEFRLEVDPLPVTTNLTVTAGAVSVWKNEGMEQIEAGQSILLRKNAPVRSKGSPHRALRRAQRLVQDGHLGEAIERYEALVKRHPRSAEAQTARLTLGRLELERDNPRRALVHFEAYLSGSGVALKQEARYGRIRALRALGRSGEERRAITRFLAEHPSSIYASRLAERQRALETAR